MSPLKLVTNRNFTIILLFFNIAVFVKAAVSQDSAALDQSDLDRSSARATAHAQSSANVGQPNGQTNGQPIGQSHSQPGGGQPAVPQPPINIPVYGTKLCYSCVDCHKILNNTTVKQCPPAPDPKLTGKCVIYAEKYQAMNKLYYIRGCASERGSCADVKRSHRDHSDVVSLDSCAECEGDYCNSVSRSLPQYALALLTLLVTPCMIKMIAS